MSFPGYRLKLKPRVKMNLPLVDSESSIASPLAVTSSREWSSKSSLHWATMKGTHAVLSVTLMYVCLDGLIIFIPSLSALVTFNE